MDFEHLNKLAQVYSAHEGRSLITTAKRVGLHSRVFTRLKNGLGCNVQTFNAAMKWFAESWPEDLEWPENIPRPKIDKEKAA